MDEDWVFRGIVAAVIAVIILVVVISAKHDKRMRTECVARGGEWIQTGSHLTTTYIKSGNVLIPLESVTKEYGCTR